MEQYEQWKSITLDDSLWNDDGDLAKNIDQAKENNCEKRSEYLIDRGVEPVEAKDRQLKT